jgi:sugar (pentulose or hexulose) kinase
MHRPLAMGIDVGTGSVKAGLFLPGADSPAAYASQAYAQEPVPSRPTWAEVDTERWRTALLLAVDRLPAGLRAEVGSVGVTGLFPALIAMDSEGQALRPAILYSDRRSTAELEDLRARGLDRAIERVAGGEPTPGTTSALSYLWLSSNEPEVDVQARWFGHGTTWLGAWLTGQIAIDASNASMTGLYDTRAGGWSDALMAELAIDPARWPPIVGSGRPIGGLRPEVAGLLGLPVGTPVTLAGGDTACAAVGAGCADSGRCFLSAMPVPGRVPLRSPPLLCRPCPPRAMA